MRRLRAGLPPLNVLLDLIELAECAVHPFRSAQHLVEILTGDAVSEQGHLEGVLGTFAQTALARKTLGIPKISP
ncbi:hypothetical protein D3C72_2062800 [compost metagenome]